MVDKTDKPDWYDEGKLRRAYFDAANSNYSGWVIDLQDGTCRYANAPLLGADPGEQPDGSYLTQQECDIINEKAPRWGDRVPLIEGEADDLPRANGQIIIERYDGP